MSEPTHTNYTFGDNLTYMFQDPKWVNKLLIGALLSLVPILNLVTGGYALRIINNIRTEQEPVLPEWSDALGKYFVDGLWLFVIGLVYSIPLWIIGLLSGAPLAMLGTGDNLERFGALFGATSCLMGLIGLVYTVALVFWLQGAIVNYAVKGEFGAALAFNEIWQIVQANVGKMVLTVVAVVVASLLVGIIGGVLGLIPCCGWLAAWVISFVATFYVLLVLAYTCGHIAKTV